MKIITLISTLLLALLCISCSEDGLANLATESDDLTDTATDNESDEVEPIEVQVYSQVADATRLSGEDWEDGDEIGIYMIYSNSYTELVSNVRYETSALAAGRFSPVDDSDKIYFPSNTSTTDIFAYYPYSSAAGTLGDIAIDISSQRQQDQAQIDLLMGYVGGIDMSEREDQVIFEFEHQLSRVDFIVYAGVGYEIDNLDGMTISISGQSTTANYSAHTDELSSYGATEDIIFNSATDSENKCVLASAIILPQTTSSDCSVSFELENGHAFSFNLDRVVFEEGQNRIYNVRLNQTGIETISATIGAWGDLEVYEGEKYDYIAIVDEAGLIAFREAVNSGTSQDAALLCDITLTSEWTPIGTESNPFVATFNGGSHTISGLQLTDPNLSFQGLFGVVGDGVGESCVANVVIDTPTIDSGTSCGVVVGISNYATILNCSVTDGTVTSLGYAGGIVGTAISTVIKFCTVDSTVIEGVSDSDLVGDMRDSSIIID